jgi:hypothetical protein
MVDKAENTDLENNDLKQDQEGQEEGQGNPEFEINLGDSPSQQPRKGNPVVQRVIGQRDKAREEATAYKSEIETLRQKVSQLEGSNSTPSYEDFDTEEDYRQAVINWNAQNSSVAPKQNTGDQFQRFLAQQAEEKAVSNHYSRAESLAEKFPDYSVSEQSAKDILGDQLSLEVARLSDRSAELMLYFGRNPQEAQRFKNLASRDGTKAAIELGRMEAQLNIQQKNSTLPEPDEPLEGGNTSSPVSGFERRLKQARSSGNRREAINIRKEAQSAGVYLE